MGMDGYVCIYVCICMVCMYMHGYVCICMYMYVYVCICMCIYVYVCVYMYMYVYTYIYTYSLYIITSMREITHTHYTSLQLRGSTHTHYIYHYSCVCSRVIFHHYRFDPLYCIVLPQYICITCPHTPHIPLIGWFGAVSSHCTW